VSYARPRPSVLRHEFLALLTAERRCDRPRASSPALLEINSSATHVQSSTTILVNYEFYFIFAELPPFSSDYFRKAAVNRFQRFSPKLWGCVNDLTSQHTAGESYGQFGFNQSRTYP
jgi:hypothetical protein